MAGMAGMVEPQDQKRRKSGRKKILNDEDMVVENFERDGAPAYNNLEELSSTQKSRLERDQLARNAKQNEM